jgi:hypothetical protein
LPLDDEQPQMDCPYHTEKCVKKDTTKKSLNCGYSYAPIQIKTNFRLVNHHIMKVLVIEGVDYAAYLKKKPQIFKLTLFLYFYGSHGVWVLFSPAEA